MPHFTIDTGSRTIDVFQRATRGDRKVGLDITARRAGDDLACCDLTIEQAVELAEALVETLRSLGAVAPEQDESDDLVSALDKLATAIMLDADARRYSEEGIRARRDASEDWTRRGRPVRYPR